MQPPFVGDGKNAGAAHLAELSLLDWREADIGGLARLVQRSEYAPLHHLEGRAVEMRGGFGAREGEG